MQTATNLIRIQRQVMSGLSWRDPRSKVADTVENRETWNAVSRDIAAMKAKGILPMIPWEIDLDPPA